MQIAMVGLGRMGANMVRRLQRAGHECVAYDVNEAAVTAMEAEGVRGARTPQQVVAALAAPRHIWLMVPAAYVADTIARFEPLLSPGDTIIDGGNSWYRDDVDRAAPLAAKGIHYVDVGTSGGVFGLERGYCLMVGGPTDVGASSWRRCSTSLAPGIDRRPAHRAATGEPSHEPSAAGCTAAPSGAGHFVKMVHNGIEYGLMAAYAEGLNVLAKANIGSESHAKDAETAPAHAPRVLPLRHRPRRGHRAVAPRQRGVTSWLLDLTAAALHADPLLDEFAGRVSDSGEGRWTIHAAVDEGVPVPTLAASLWDRFYSRDRGDVAHKVLSRDARRVRRPPRGEEGHDMSTAAQQPVADALVLFGATGDLSKRKLFPALYRMETTALLKVPVIGVARSDWNDEGFRQHAHDSILASIPDAEAAVIESLMDRLDLIQGDYADPKTWETLASTLRQAQERARRVLHGHSAVDVPHGRRVARIGGLNERGRIVVEKPFGRDLASAKELNDTLHSVFPRSASSASTTTSARRASRTCWCSASATRCSSRCGTATTCAACRSR
jgi:6-phosphogluconate dehydrogenase